MYKVLKDFKGSPDGIEVIQYVAGEEVELVESLAVVALHEKWVKKLPTVDREAAARAKAAKEAAEHRAELEQQLADLGAKWDAAADADKPAIEEKALAVRAELEALK